MTYSYGEGAYVKKNIPIGYDVNYGYAAYAGANLKVSCMVNARSMTEPITLEFKDAEGNVILSDNSYHIYDYAQALAQADSKYKTLMCAMLDYGASVQTFKGYRTGDLASDYIENIDPNYTPDNNDVPTVTETDKTDFAALKAAMQVYGYKYVGSTLTATAQTRIRMFFAQTDADAAANTTVTVNGQEARIYKDNTTYDYYCIDIDGIAAKNIFDTYTVVFTNGDNSVTGTYNAASYYNVAGSAQYVVQKMYLYCKAAIAALAPQG